MQPNELLICAQRLQALAQAGIEYHKTAYDLERYEEIRTLSVRLLRELTDEPMDKILRVFASETGYQTPKVDVRAVVFKDDKLLLVKETIDQGRWTLPGGWADVGYSPFEIAAKETLEEAGLIVKPLRLLALFDNRGHGHPPQPWHVYKAFIQCEGTGGAITQQTNETSGAGWFGEDEIAALALSTDRITASQLITMFSFARDPNLPALCD